MRAHVCVSLAERNSTGPGKAKPQPGGNKFTNRTFVCFTFPVRATAYICVSYLFTVLMSVYIQSHWLSCCSLIFKKYKTFKCLYRVISTRREMKKTRNCVETRRMFSHKNGGKFCSVDIELYQHSNSQFYTLLQTMESIFTLKTF